MPLARRDLLIASGLGLAAAVACAPEPPPLDGPDGVLAWIRERPDQASFLVHDGRGGRLERNVDTPRPIASAVKVVHLAAYARAAVAGRIDPGAPVPVRNWERWYLAGTDGGAHPQALALLGATSDSTVTWDQIVQAMIVVSDNAAADLLRAELGDPALIEAAAAVGWAPLDLPSILGETLLLVLPERAARPRRTVAYALAQEYADGGPLRELAAARVPQAGTDVERLLQWADGTWAASVRQLVAMHGAAATGRLDPPEVSAVMREHLERALADRLPQGVLAVGQKGGSLPGLLSNAVTVRREDGTIGVAALSLDGMAMAPWLEALQSGAVTVLSQQLLFDAAQLGRVP